MSNQASQGPQRMNPNYFSPCTINWFSHTVSVSHNVSVTIKADWWTTCGSDIHVPFFFALTCLQVLALLPVLTTGLPVGLHTNHFLWAVWAAQFPLCIAMWENGVCCQHSLFSHVSNVNTLYIYIYITWLWHLNSHIQPLWKISGKCPDFSVWKLRYSVSTP